MRGYVAGATRTSARLEDGQWVINGSKAFITNSGTDITSLVTITARTGVTKSVEPGKLVGGMMPAMDYQQWRKSQVLYARLPELFERLKKLEKKIGD